MSEKPSEYLKRTCLICGCHTNQTINIYEPRSGPNIVQLIQAKFKFQPLNEDKYLCFSCNNWLINWHSLQALNSNDAESPSGNFRSHMNNTVPDKDAGSQRAVCRPVAAVRPRQLTENNIQNTQISGTKQKSPPNSLATAKLSNLDCTKRSFRQHNHLRGESQLQSLRACCMCGRAIAVRIRVKSATLLKKTPAAKCSKCRQICLRGGKSEPAEVSSAPHKLSIKRSARTRSVKPLNLVNAQLDENQLNNTYTQNQYLRRPLIDGKIVSMLRRLGTTLSRENENSNTGSSSATKLPPIMSPQKQKTCWTRQLEDDEILFDFNTAISEVLPTIAGQLPKQVSRKLTYQISINGYEANEKQETNMDSGRVKRNECAFTVPESPPHDIYDLIPKGLSIRLF